jgi:hypothetical protein
MPLPLLHWLSSLPPTPRNLNADSVLKIPGKKCARTVKYATIASFSILLHSQCTVALTCNAVAPDDVCLCTQISINGKSKFVSVHSVKAYWGRKVMALHMLNFGAVWSLLVASRHSRFTTGERASYTFELAMCLSFFQLQAYLMFHSHDGWHLYHLPWRCILGRLRVRHACINTWHMFNTVLAGGVTSWISNRTHKQPRAKSE